MTVLERPQPLTVGEYAALDLLNSVATPKSEVIDWLDTGEGVLDWMVQVGLCTQDEVAPLLQTEQRDKLEAAKHQVRAFRETFRFMVSAIVEHPESAIPPEATATLNELLSKGVLNLQLDTASLDLKAVHRFQSPRDILPRLAASCAEFLATADLQYVRKCENHSCTLYFCDMSKGHKRRWCSMDICGNRAKAAKYRAAKSARIN